MLRESNRKIVNLSEENDKLKNNISGMRAEIADKSNKIDQLDTINTKLYKHNNNLAELCSKGKLLEKEKEKDREREENGGKGEMDETE